MAPSATAAAAPNSARIVKLDASQNLAQPAKPKKSTKSGNKDGKPKKRKANEDDMSEDDSESDVDFVNVDLDFFGFIESDYQAVKNLLVQLFSHDAKDLDIAGIADHFIEQEEDVGTGIKADGEESDPLAFIGALPWQMDKPYITSLKSYLLKKVAQRAALVKVLQNPSNKIGIVLQERLVNMPVQVVSPLLRIFDEEMTTTGAPFDFTHLLFVTKTFLARPEDFPEDDGMDVDAPKQTKKKKNKSSNSSLGAQAASQAYLYHLEDELVANLAGPEMWTDYAFDNAPARGQMGVGEDFGVEMRGRVALVERSKLQELVKQTETMFA